MFFVQRWQIKIEFNDMEEREGRDVATFQTEIVTPTADVIGVLQTRNVQMSKHLTPNKQIWNAVAKYQAGPDIKPTVCHVRWYLFIHVWDDKAESGFDVASVMVLLCLISGSYMYAKYRRCPSHGQIPANVWHLCNVRPTSKTLGGRCTNVNKCFFFVCKYILFR